MSRGVRFSLIGLIMVLIIKVKNTDFWAAYDMI